MSKNLSALEKISETKIKSQDKSEVEVVINSSQELDAAGNCLDEEIEMLLQEEPTDTPNTLISHRDIWNELMDTFNEDRKAVAEYNSSKLQPCDVPISKIMNIYIVI